MQLRSHAVRAGRWLLLLCLCCAAGARAETPLVLGITPEDYAPYFMGGGASGKVTGIVPDLWRHIAARLGREAEFRQLPRARLENAVFDRQLDAITLAREWTATPERFLFSEPLFDVRDVVLVKSGAAAKSLADLAGRRIGTRRGYSYPAIEPWFRDGRLLRQDADSEAAMLQMLQLGRTPAMVINEYVGQWLIRQQHLEGRFRSVHALDGVAYRFVFRVGRDDLLAACNREIATMKRDGSLQRTLTVYQP